MVKIVEIQFAPWDKTYHFDVNGLDLEKANYVIVQTQLGLEIGKVVGFLELSEEATQKQYADLKPVLRKANAEDLEKVMENKNERSAAGKVCKKLIKKHKLPIKLVDVHYTFERTRITFAFIADGRVDFRDLVRDLTKQFKKNVRMEQIGVRDEVKFCGDLGSCGRELCCRGVLKELANVSSETAEIQQVAHRGSERLSGVCARLKCCLNYEENAYNEILAKLPPIGSRVRTDSGRGEVVGLHVLRGSVEVKLDTEDDSVSIIEVPVIKEKN